jgi:hypothetical protein
MITFEQILLMIFGASPALAAIIGIAWAVYKVIKEFNGIKNEIIDTKEYQTLKEQIVLVNKENRELKKTIRELLTKIDRIDRTKGE